MPLEYCLRRQELIASPECRLPFSNVSRGLATELDGWLEKLGCREVVAA